MKCAMLACLLLSLCSSAVRADDPKPPPRPIAEADSVLAVYREDWGLGAAPGESPALILAAWPDGRVVWSKESLVGGAPYLAGKVEPNKVAALLARFEKDGLFADESLNRAHFGPDSAFITVLVKSGKKQVKMQSWHEMGEVSEKLVGTGHGLELLGGRRRLDVLRKEPATYLYYRMVWSETRGKLADLIPQDGKPTGGKLVLAGELSWQEEPPQAPGLKLSWEKNMLTVAGPKVPGGEVKVWYLEAYCRPGSTDRDWKETVIGHKTELLAAGKDGRSLKLRCTLNDGVVVEHAITAAGDEVDFRLTAHNPTKQASQAHWAQPCVRVDRFTGRGKTDYLPKCFVFRDGKPTRMPFEPWATKARYVPGQVWCPKSVDRNDVNPRPLSEVVPSNGLIGCYSADDQWILATAWEPYQELFQGVIACLHSDFRIGGLKPGETKQVRGKLYLVPARMDDLLKRYHKDFPEHARDESPKKPVPPGGSILFSSLAPRGWDVYLAEPPHPQPLSREGERGEAGARRLTDHSALDYNAAFSPDGQRVAFVSERDGNLELYVARRDGSDRKRLTDDFALDDHPSWSPDGRRIAFCSTRQPSATPGRAWNAIYVMNADGTGVRRVSPKDAADYSPAWSPKGDWIACASGSGAAGGTDLYVMKPDGSERKLVVKDGGWPAFSGDGEALYFHSKRKDTWGIWRVHLNGSGLERVTPADVEAFTPRVSADGKWLAAAVKRGQHRQIERLELTTRKLTAVTKGATDHWNPSISADGQHVVYHRMAPDFLVPNVERWGSPPGCPFQMLRLAGAFPALSPDGQRVALTAGNFAQIDVMNLNGSGRKNIFTSSARSVFSLSWAHTGDRIAFSHGTAFQGAEGKVDLETLAPDGSARQALTDKSGNNGFPSLTIS